LIYEIFVSNRNKNLQKPVKIIVGIFIFILKKKENSIKAIQRQKKEKKVGFR